jgi:thiol-disulfide isomerase/thioredoxin
MSVHLLTDQDFNTALQSNDTVIVKYFADWCGNCKLISPKFRRLSDSETYSSAFFTEVNAEENPESRKMAGVDNLPYFAVFKNGALVSGMATSKIEVVESMIQSAVQQ